MLNTSAGTPYVGNNYSHELGVSATQKVYQQLRHQIINIILEPGTAILKNEVAKQFGVSHTPVREAILRLGEEGLVDIFPQSRTTVSLIDLKHAQEFQFLRLSVEIEVVRVLSKSINKSYIKGLKIWIDRQFTELNSGDQCAFKLADNNFHKEMLEQAGVQGLSGLLETYRGHYDRIRVLYLMAQARRKTVTQEHQAIITAFENSDEVAAEIAVRKHLGKSLLVVDGIKDHYPHYFL